MPKGEYPEFPICCPAPPPSSPVSLIHTYKRRFRRALEEAQKGGERINTPFFKSIIPPLDATVF